MRTIVTRLQRRWRILRAALTQDWHQLTCRTCGGDWWYQGSFVSGDCPNCEARAFRRQLRVLERRQGARQRVAS